MAKEFERKFLPASSEAIALVLENPEVAKTGVFLYQGYVEKENCVLGLEEDVLKLAVPGFNWDLAVHYGSNHEKIAEARRILSLKDSDPHFTIRFRVKGGGGFLTIKTSDQDELEEEVGRGCCFFFLDNVCHNKIAKTRYTIPRENSTRCWEIDVFKGAREGLILIEAEMDTADEVLKFPAWVGEEVTGNAFYSNYNLGKQD